MMLFSYNDYQFHCLVIPVFSLIFFSVMFITGAFRSAKEIAFKGFSAERVLMLLFCILVFGFFVRLEGGRLLNGGIYLLFDKEEDSIIYEGVVEDITSYSQYYFPNINKYRKKYGVEKNENIYGYKISVNDTILKAPERGTLIPGDYVSVLFLPKSKYILSIDKNTREILASEKDSYS